MTETIRLLIAEDNKIVRNGLCKAIGSKDGFTIIGSASSGTEALQLLEGGLQPDVLLTDLNMPDLDGIELAERLQVDFPQVRTIILTMHSREEYRQQAKAAGVHGYVMKHVDLH